MRRHRRKLICIALVMAGIALFLLWPERKQPSYGGKRLNEWLNDLAQNPKDTNAIAAVKAIGTDALPTLLEGVGFQESSFRKAFFSEVNKLLLKLRIRSKPLNDPQARQAFGVLQGFKVLGPLASNAIPPLEMLASTNLQAATALYFIGPMTVPAMTNALNRSSAQLQWNILVYLSEFGTNAGSAFPVVLPLLQSTNKHGPYYIRAIAAQTLGRLRSNPGIGVPALTNLFTDPESSARMYAIQSVGRFGIESGPAVAGISNALADPHPMVREAATNALRTINKAMHALD